MSAKPINIRRGMGKRKREGKQNEKEKKRNERKKAGKGKARRAVTVYSSNAHPAIKEVRNQTLRNII